MIDRTLVPFLSAFALLLSGGVALLSSSDTQAQRINGPVILTCDNQRNEQWVTFHAPRDGTFFNQRLVLGEGSYSVSMVPSSSMRFNAFVYRGKQDSFVGSRSNVASHTQRFDVDWSGEEFLIQLKRTSGCTNCRVTMTLRAYNCPTVKSQPARPMCRPNQCYQDGVFGTGRCIAKRGAKGGMCGSPGN
ncbi:hypothetical protein [Parerythrobacter jejuensis]|uniref:Uncharacterized protein n=1 Tax=Parerythrobacter jejuensis TaxID=795812 RepID=A0A845AQZ2_9SPHN|nr:hypothetical protein [Parerythrobacter jejuensis]MXP31889.1 hypothetical protein [Parerythrobacter jejuensis]